MWMTVGESGQKDTGVQWKSFLSRKKQQHETVVDQNTLNLLQFFLTFFLLDFLVITF